jgi:hypothetical protein
MRCWVTVSSRVGRGECRFLKRIAENFRSLASRHRHCHAPFVLCVKPDRLLAELSALIVVPFMISRSNALRLINEML